MIRALVIGVVVVAAGVAHAQGVSPGPLSSDHAALEGVDNCVRCHSGGDAISAPACLSCHKALGQRIAANVGYHATTGKDCASCHPDHRGTKAALVRWPGGRDRFDHDKAGYKLAGGHAKVACRDCHKVALLTGGVASALTADEKPRTYLGVGTSCASCHKDTHRPSLGTDCQRCHTPVSWHATVAGSFDHATTKYPLAGAHAKVTCEKCHGGTAQKLANLHPAFDTCQSCHKDPHAGAMGDAKACATCHREAAWKDLHYDRKTHAPRTLPLTAGHAKPACAACHAAKLDQKPAATCTPCHADAHKPSLGTRCETCHQTTAWTTAAPKRDFHDRTAYPLRGLHTTVACERCHDPKRPRATRFRPLPHGKCLDCHADPHAGEAAPPCERCHAVETTWKPARFELADHAKTKFALDGAHRAVPCAKCHPSAPKPPGFRRGNPACEACHADPHGGQFADKGACVTCHDVVAWSPSTFTKDAHAKGGFKLAGKHDVACARCHAKKFVDTPTQCSTCHDDRHAGQFAGRSCIECHAGAEWKPTPGFDHARTFALRGRHASAACARCHPKTEIRITPALSVESEVYKLGAGSRDCAGCHRAQHGDPKSGLERPRLLAAATRACTTCHGETSWRDLAVAPLFDHGTTGAPLVGGHTSTSCTSCHQPGRRALPALELCSGCHQDRHAGRLGDRCESCHTPASWKQDQLLVDHRRTRLPLVGAHAVQGCPTCHKDAQPGTYRGLDPTCRACHLHTVEDRRPHPDHTKDLAFNTCEHCHSVLAWRPAHIDHDKFWPLSGKHATTACTRCHAPGDPFAAAPTACNACHVAPGAGTPTDHDMFGAACGDVRQCQNCHTTSGWTTSKFPCHPRDFPSSHHGSTCAQCHTSGNNMMYSCTTGCHRGIDNNHPREDGYMRGEQDCAKAGCHFGGRGGG